VTCGRPVARQPLVEGIASVLGLPYLLVAEPMGAPRPADTVKTVAVCAGSGWDVLKDSDADMLVTGEMSHHHALRAAMQGKWVVNTLHSNSERAFLGARLREQLEDRLRHEGNAAEVVVSECDADPFRVEAVKGA